MRILWIKCKRFERDVDKATWIEMVKHINGKSHNIYLIIPALPPKYELNLLRHNVKYISRLSFKILYSLSFSFNLFFYSYFLIHSFHPDIIILDEVSLFAFLHFIFLSKLKLIKVKFVLDIRSIPVEVYGIIRKTKKRIFEIALYSFKYLLNGITVISPTMRKEVINKYNVPSQKIGIWSSGVSPEEFSPEKMHISSNFIFGDKFVIIYHGVLTKNRGLFESVKALNLLRDKYPDIVFFILGNGYIKEELISLVKKLRLEEKIIFHSPVPYEEVPQYIKLCDVGIIPLPDIIWWRVSSPLKLMEYLAMEKPVIVTDIEAHRNVIGNLPCGIFIKSSEPEEIAKGIEKAYKMRNKLKEIGKTGRKLIISKYTWEKQAENLIKFLAKL